MNGARGHSMNMTVICGWAARAGAAAAIALAVGCGSSSSARPDAGGGAGGATAKGGAGAVAGAGGGGAAATGGSAAGKGGAGGAGASGAAGSGGAGASAGTQAGAGAGGTAASAGSGGSAGTAETGGAGGTAGNSGCAGNAGATAGAGGAPLSVTAALDGQKFVAPCGRTESADFLVCENIPPRCSSISGPYLTRGNLMRDDTVTVDGPAGAIYDVTLRVRGVVEPKHFINGATGAPANGSNYAWYVGGEPNTSGNDSTYMLWVSARGRHETGALDGQYYFLTPLIVEAHFTYPIDYTATFPVAAGARIRFLADDPNCSMVKNCDDTSIDGIVQGPTTKCNPSTIADLPASAGIPSPTPASSSI